jgi:hypothetical protein
MIWPHLISDKAICTLQFPSRDMTSYEHPVIKQENQLFPNIFFHHENLYVTQTHTFNLLFKLY